MAITEGGKLYNWGSNQYRTLGRDTDGKSCNCPDQPLILKDKICTDVCGGLRHAVAISDDGRVWTCGNGRKGQLGLIGENRKAIDVVDRFAEVPLPEGSGKPIQSKAGAYYTAILTDSGQLVMWGDNKFGAMARDPYQTKIVTVPTVIPQSLFENRKIKAIHSGWDHMLAIAENGDVYSWGRKDLGQIGRQPEEDKSTQAGDASQSNVLKYDYRPAIIPGFKPDIIHAAGYHNLAIVDRALYSWGWNEHGICGYPEDVAFINAPSEMPALKGREVHYVGGGMGHSFVKVRAQKSSSNNS